MNPSMIISGLGRPSRRGPVILLLVCLAAVILGAPVWNDDIANPMMTYLRDTDLTGQRVMPYWTYVTSQGRTEQSFSQRIRNSETMPGLALRSPGRLSHRELGTVLDTWLREGSGG